jgi:hypothetical protein
MASTASDRELKGHDSTLRKISEPPTIAPDLMREPDTAVFPVREAAEAASGSFAITDVPGGELESRTSPPLKRLTFRVDQSHQER